LADRVALIRNHGEVVAKDMGVTNLVNLVGFNYRMTEIEAAIGIQQLRKLPALHRARVDAADFLTARLGKMPGLTTPVVKKGVVHGYYRYALKFDESLIGIGRDTFVDALNAEGIPMVKGYTEPLYLEPMYQQRIGFGKDGFPFTYSGYKGTVSYESGICPVVERLYSHELMCTDVCHADITEADLLDVVTAIRKVYGSVDELR
ncbi:MAG: DegT/DnrJ/EryC1/StrS family aminotransferase, partial [Gemmatimonadaceae bacterium]